MNWYYRIEGETVFADVYYDRNFLGRLTFNNRQDFGEVKHKLEPAINFIDSNFDAPPMQR